MSPTYQGRLVSRWEGNVSHQTDGISLWGAITEGPKSLLGRLVDLSVSDDQLRDLAVAAARAHARLDPSGPAACLTPEGAKYVESAWAANWFRSLAGELQEQADAADAVMRSALQTGEPTP